MNATFYRYKHSQFRRTPEGVQYWAPKKDDTEDLRHAIDRKTDELEQCLGQKLHRDWFAVYVPPDWYVSSCTGQQLVPSYAALELCRAKGLNVPETCRGVLKPTKQCPCPCNFRAIVQDGFLVVTAPNLALYKAELTRIVTGVNNPWADKSLVKCLR